MYPKTPGCFSDLSAALYYKSYCFFLKLLIVLPVHFPLLHFTPPKVLRFYYNLTFRCVRYFGGSASSSTDDSEEKYRKMEYDAILAEAGGENQDFFVTKNQANAYDDSEIGRAISNGFTS